MKDKLIDEQTKLRNEVITRISLGNFEELMPLLSIVAPITQEEKTKIIVSWYANQKNIIISKYLIPLIDQDYELITEIDKNNLNNFKR